MNTQTTYKLEDVIADNPTATPSEIIKKIDEFLINKKTTSSLFCGPRVYRYIYTGRNKPSEIIKKIDEFLINKKTTSSLFCGPRVYRYIQMSSKYKVEENENNLEFPVLFGKWANEEQTISLYLSPDKCKEDEFIIES